MLQASYLAVFIFFAGAVLSVRFGYLVGSRTSVTGDRLVPVAHASAWFGLAFLFFLKAAFLLIAIWAPGRIDVVSALVVLGMVALGVFIWGMGTYVVHVWLGAARQLTVLWAGLAAATTILLTTSYVAAQPAGVLWAGSGPGVGFRQPELAGLSLAWTVPMLLGAVLASFYLFQVLLVDDRQVVWRLRCATFGMSLSILSLGFGLAPWLAFEPALAGMVQLVAAVVACLCIATGLYVRAHGNRALGVLAARSWA